MIQLLSNISTRDPMTVFQINSNSVKVAKAKKTQNLLEKSLSLNKNTKPIRQAADPETKDEIAQ